MHTTEETILEAFKSINQPLGTLSTVNKDGSPQSAGLYSLFDERLNIYFITRRDSRKYINIQNNPHVAFVITTENPPRTIQIEGTAHEVTDPHEEAEYFTKLIAIASEHTQMPPVSQIPGGEMAFVKITPTWVRSGNFEALREGDKFMEVNVSQP